MEREGIAAFGPSAAAAAIGLPTMIAAESGYRRMSDGRFATGRPNGRFRRVSPVAPRPGEGPLTEPTAGAQLWPKERVLMPQMRHSIRAHADELRSVRMISRGDCHFGSAVRSTFDRRR